MAIAVREQECRWYCMKKEVCDKKSFAKNPNNARFGWFWYNDTEIFHDGQAQINAKVSAMADTGITHLITFSVTHFRWSFRPWWGILNECLEKICQAAHANGMKVIEHHSCNLGHFPDTPQKIAAFKQHFIHLNSSMDSWPGLVDYLLDPKSAIENWCQIDGDTGKPSQAYSGHARCFNHPEFVKEYLRYLESIYACCVDGIMTDDVQYFSPQACACPHCRELFARQSGFELPLPEHWASWHGNMLDPMFLAWLKFRFDATHRFHETVKLHYESLGLPLLRPNYTSSGLTCDLTACNTENLPSMDWYFQECCVSTVIRYSFPSFLTEQKHRAMIAAKRHIPHMMLFYAHRQELLEFVFGLARQAGSLFTNTPVAFGKVDESPYRVFEQKYAHLLFDAAPIVTVGFLDSCANRHFSGTYEASRIKFWMQSCSLGNIPHVLVSISCPETWKQFRVLCVNEVHLLSNEDIALLKQYADDGGTLVISGAVGDQDEAGRIRTQNQIESLWGFAFETAPMSVSIHPFGDGHICTVGYSFGYPGGEASNRNLFVDYPRRFDYMSIYELYNNKEEFSDVWIPRGVKGKPTEPHRAGRDNKFRRSAEARGQVIDLLHRLCVSSSPFDVDGLPEGILATPFIAVNGDITIQLLNARDVFPRSDDDVLSHDDPIPFPLWTTGAAHFSLLTPEARWKARFLDFYDNECELLCSRNDGRLQVTLQGGSLKTGGMIHISHEGKQR